ncbi:hypothetical protein [Phyllobacterium sp. P30BS-XVII]|uniref:hypothetical protein n=1 Tax=Phyllobacterium sp. P30BS-XVII TaxID=2587046 RepID=UPI0015F887AD|nr:hypothetical protein [Phyllobacterium sp. P30BS-XVII]MBA8904181.1 hypothetical protein [Phyllobacterium sp. P30BS-XVII]
MKTFGEILKAGMELHGECPDCRRKDKLDLARLNSNGTWLGKIVRCKCGGEVSVKIIDPKERDNYRKMKEGW